MILYVIFLAIFSPNKLFSQLYSRSWYQKILLDWIKTQNFSQNDHILEIWCAWGELTYEISKQFWNITWLDTSSSMIQYAKKKFPNNHFVFQIGKEIPFHENTFDHIIWANILNIVSHKSEFINEILRIKKEHWKISFLVPSEYMKAQFSWKIFTHFDDASRFVWFLVARKVSQSEIKSILKNSWYKISFQTYENDMLFSVNIAK